MTTPNKQKRKRQTISLDEKRIIIEASKTKVKTVDLVKHFNNKYKYTAIDGIIKKKNEILEAIDNGASGKRTRIQDSKYPALEEALLKWLKEVRSENVPVDGPLLKVS
jgi:hypothetical protein